MKLVYCGPRDNCSRIYFLINICHRSHFKTTTNPIKDEYYSKGYLDIAYILRAHRGDSLESTTRLKIILNKLFSMKMIPEARILKILTNCTSIIQNMQLLSN